MNPPDSHHLNAAQGWLELGNWREANEELELISPELRSHPDVLEVRFGIYAQVKKWEVCVDLADTIVGLDPARSFGWVHRSFALHELKRTQEAFDQLLPAAERFSGEWVVPYNLACYCSQMGRLDESRGWFKKAMAIDSRAPAKAGIDDPDLKLLWDTLSGTSWEKT